MILSSSAIALFPSATTLAASSYQLLSRERRVCELECLRVQPAADAQRHAERGDEPEAPAALVVPRVLVWIKRQPGADLREPAREFGIGDDLDGIDCVRLLTAHGAPPRTGGAAFRCRLQTTIKRLRFNQET